MGLIKCRQLLLKFLDPFLKFSKCFDDFVRGTPSSVLLNTLDVKVVRTVAKSPRNLKGQSHEKKCINYGHGGIDLGLIKCRQLLSKLLDCSLKG